MKRLSALLLALSCLFLTACSAGWEEPQNSLYETLADYYGADDTDEAPTALTAFSLPYLPGETVEPYHCADGAQLTISALLYEGLFSLAPDLTPQPLLAESYRYDSATRTCTVTLRSDLYFSDGGQLTSTDVVYSLRRAAASPRYAQRLSTMAQVYAQGTGTVVIQLSQDNAAFASRLDVPIIKYGTGSYNWPVGTGPYTYATDEVGPCLLPNGQWWQKKELPLQRIGLVRCKDEDTMAYAFYAREVQLLVCDLTATGTGGVYGSGDYTDAATTTMHFLGVNTARAPLSDAALRRALSLGINRQGCIDAYLLGHATPAQFPLSPASPLYPHGLSVTYTPDNFDTAMAQAGYAQGNSVSLTLLVNSENSFKVDAARRIAEDLSRHDVTITVRALPWAQYLTALQTGDYDLYYGECRLTADWDLSALVATGGPLNYGAYSNAQTDALLESYLSAPEEGRAEAMEALCRQLREDAPLLPVAFKSVSLLLPSDAVEGVLPTATNPFYNFPDWEIHMAEE